MFRSLAIPVITILVFFLLLLGYTKLFGPISFQVNSTTTNKSDTFSTSGQGKVTVVPDLAVVTVGVTANGTTVKQAQDDLNSNINKVSQEVKKLGVDSKDIQTENYNINPNYDFTKTGGVQTITGYSASSNLQIKVRKVDQASQVIDTATKSGANQVGGISFESSDPTAAQNQAREQAVADAKKKASDAAKIAGFKLGRVINYTENLGDTAPRPMALSAQVEKDVANPTQVEAGSNEIIVNVTLFYEIL